MNKNELYKAQQKKKQQRAVIEKINAVAIPLLICGWVLDGDYVWLVESSLHNITYNYGHLCLLVAAIGVAQTMCSAIRMAPVLTIVAGILAMAWGVTLLSVALVAIGAIGVVGQWAYHRRWPGDRHPDAPIPEWKMREMQMEAEGRPRRIDTNRRGGHLSTYAPGALGLPAGASSARYLEYERQSNTAFDEWAPGAAIDPHNSGMDDGMGGGGMGSSF